MDVIVILFAAGLAWLLYKGAHASTSTAPGAGAINGASASAQNFLDNIGQGIFQWEGAGKPGATNSWNNNPGNVGGGLATFNDSGDGWDALNGFIQQHAAEHPDWNFNQFFAFYLNGDPTKQGVTAQGDATAYAAYVANYVGVVPTTSVGSLLGYA
jgi:hypothetical protein